MAEIINLRRARKRKTRQAEAAQADSNRIKQGTTKAVREMARARKEHDDRTLDSQKLDRDN